MQIQPLFRIQKALDQKIVRKHHLEGRNLLPAKVMALRVEVAELCNETRIFKYWSLKDPSAQEVILEEFVDCLHFVLSIGWEKNEQGQPFKKDLVEDAGEMTGGASAGLENSEGLNTEGLIVKKRITERDAEGMAAEASAVRGNEDTFHQFERLFRQIDCFSRQRTTQNYRLLFQALIDLGQTLGFSEEDIEQAYFDKNRVNHERQEQGY